MSSSKQAGRAVNQTKQTTLATHVQLADTHWTRFRGLMGKTNEQFPAGNGLWIVPCRGVHTMGMRMVIDAVYLDRDHIVVHVVNHLRPWRVAPVMMRSVSVLELPPGTISATQTEVGDRINFEGFGA